MALLGSIEFSLWAGPKHLSDGLSELWRICDIKCRKAERDLWLKSPRSVSVS